MLMAPKLLGTSDPNGLGQLCAKSCPQIVRLPVEPPRGEEDAVTSTRAQMQRGYRMVTIMKIIIMTIMMTPAAAAVNTNMLIQTYSEGDRKLLQFDLA